MGADGHVLTVPVASVPEQYRDLDPSKIGWQTRTLHGSDEFLWRYSDTNGAGDTWDSPADRHHEYQRLHSAVTRPQSPRLIEQALRDIHAYEALSEEERRLNQRYWEFSIWLDANGEDWQVWT